MSRPKPGRRKDALVWGVSVGMLLTAFGLYVAAAPAASGSVLSPVTPSPVVAGAPPPQPSTSPPNPSDRVLAFQRRLAAMRPLQAALLRVFLGPSPPAVARRTVAMARVRPGRTPQACLAQAVYYEARGEPAEGQAAVAQVVLNRTRSGRHPADVCGAVFEGAARPGCQFSFACDPRLTGRPREAAAWRRAEDVASEVLAGRGPEGLRTATNYHADYVRPRWAAQLERTAAIGRHIFYASASTAGRALAGWTFTAPAPPSGA